MGLHKIDRTGEDLKRELTDIFKSIKDPRVKGMISIVAVDLASDLSDCKVFVSAVEGLDTAKSAALGLNNAAGFIRHELGERLSLRRIPSLRFIADNSIEKSARISKVLGDLL